LAVAAARRSAARSATGTLARGGTAAATGGTGRSAATVVGGAETVPLPEAQDVDGVTGGASAPNEDTGFGHGVDGLTPVAPDKPTATPDAGSISDPSTSSGGYTGPPADTATVTAPAPEAGTKVQFVSPPAG
jgi:hypothetical protein